MRRGSSSNPVDIAGQPMYYPGGPGTYSPSTGGMPTPTPTPSPLPSPTPTPGGEVPPCPPGSDCYEPGPTPAPGPNPKPDPTPGPGPIPIVRQCPEGYHWVGGSNGQEGHCVPDGSDSPTVSLGASDLSGPMGSIFSFGGKGGDNRPSAATEAAPYKETWNTYTALGSMRRRG